MKRFKSGMKEIADVEGIMKTEKGNMKVIEDMIVTMIVEDGIGTEIGLMKIEDEIMIKGGMMMTETQGEIMREIEKKEGPGGEMTGEGMKEGVNGTAEERIRKVEKVTASEAEDLVLLRKTEMILEK